MGSIQTKSTGDNRMNDKFIDRVALRISSQLKKIYSNGYKIGDEVYIPINSVAYDSARVMSDYCEYNGYKCGGQYDAFRYWERWVRVDLIKPKKVYDLLDEYHIEDVYIRKSIIEKSLEYYYEDLLSVSE